MGRHPDSDQQPCRCPRKEARRRARFFNKYAVGLGCYVPTYADMLDRRAAVALNDANKARLDARTFREMFLDTIGDARWVWLREAFNCVMSAKGHMRRARDYGWSLPSLTAHDRMTMIGGAS